MTTSQTREQERLQMWLDMINIRLGCNIELSYSQQSEKYKLSRAPKRISFLPPRKQFTFEEMLCLLCALLNGIEIGRRQAEEINFRIERDLAERIKKAKQENL